MRTLLTHSEHNEPSPGELRRLSVTLRRLLVNGEITTIASPRMERFRFQAPDNTAFYNLPKEEGLIFFGSGSMFPDRKTFSIQLSVYRIPMPVLAADVSIGTAIAPLALKHRKQSGPIDITLNAFMAQRVLYFHGRWTSRREVIKYTANVASGAHSEVPRKDYEKSLATISSVVKYRVTADSIGVDFGDLLDGSLRVPEFRYVANALDPVLVELLAAAEMTVYSESTKILEAILQRELA